MNHRLLTTTALALAFHNQAIAAGNEREVAAMAGGPAQTTATNAAPVNVTSRKPGHHPSSETVLLAGSTTSRSLTEAAAQGASEGGDRAGHVPEISEIVVTGRSLETNKPGPLPV